MARKLVVFFGTDVGQVFPLPDDGVATLGRGREASIRLGDLQVSRLHCRIDMAGTRIQDAGSAGGTFVNGLRVTEQLLRTGDTIRVGGTEMRVQEADVMDQPTLMPLDDPEPAPPPALLPQGIPYAVAGASVPPHPVAIPMAVPVSPAAASTGLTGRMLGNYEVGALLAQGHSGMVLRGRDVRTGNEVALKVLWPHIAVNPEMVQRLKRAALTMLPIRHPNIVALFEVGQSASYTWLAMEFIDGESLTQVIDRIGVAGMLDWRHAFRVAVHVGRALDTIHRHHIIHRNLAPQNVLVRAADKSAVLGDVVLAKALEGEGAQEITHPGEVVGDYRYMAPEQVSRGDAVDGRADLYCLGAMLYALLTGRPPFAGDSLIETVTLIRNAEPVRPTKFQMSIAAGFEGVILKLLAKKAQARFQTAADLLEELDRVGRFHGVKVP